MKMILSRWNQIAPSARDGLALAAVIGLTLLIELALVERKYGIFGGGFGQSQALAGSSILLFAAILFICHAIAVTVIFLLFRALHRTPKTRAIFHLNFIILGTGMMLAALAAKFEVLKYFSDAVSFELIKNLGGGSLFDAALFALSEGALMLGVLAVCLVGYALLFRWLVRRAEPQPAGGLRFPLSVVAAASVLLITLAWIGNRYPEIRNALHRFGAFGVVNGILAQATDLDRDGYGWFSQQIDDHPFDAARYPFALDIPNNGVDEDGIGGDFVLAAQAAQFDVPAGSLPKLPANPKNLVLVVLESTRGDAIGKLVDGREVTPNLNKLAREGSSFPAAYSHVGFTTASLKSLFSGRLETAAGGPSLFKDLKANGYRTGVFSGQPESFGDISEAVDMRAKSDVYADAETLKAERAFGFAAKGSLLVDGAVLLREFDRGFGTAAAWTRPVFLYVNFQSAHFPYYYPGMAQILPGSPIPRSEINAANKERVARTYWNAVAHADAQVGELIARLKALGVYEETLLVVTADHGESLFDDGFLGHGHMLNRQQMHIPLVTNVAGLGTSAPIGLADYRENILAMLGATGRSAGRTTEVLQYIGTLDRPSVIGLVDEGRRWTTFQLHNGEVRFSDRGRAFTYDELRRQPVLKARMDRLIFKWEQERWRARPGISQL